MVTEQYPPMLHVATPDEFFAPVSSWSRVGGAMLVTAFAALLLLSSVLRYKVTVRAQAAIRPAGELRIVQTQVGGPIRDILVAQDQTVKKGSVIATVDDSHLRTEQSKLHTAIENAALQLDQLQAQLTALDRQIAAEQDLMKRRQATAEAELRLRERELKQLLVTTAADVREARAEVEIAREELSRSRALAKQGVASEAELRKRETTLSSRCFP